MIHDDLARHLPEAGSFERAAVPLGIYVAWLANHALLDHGLCDAHADVLTRLRYREITGSELLVSVCGGSLGSEHLTDEGRAFTEQYYPGYLDDFRREFGDDVYGVHDDWDHYDRMAPRLTRALMAFRQGGDSRSRENGPWWKFWR